MYHSIIFGDKNTWDDWQIVPSTRPAFSMPSVKTKTVDIPGGDGLIDLTESLTGYPVYNNRDGSFNFIVVNDFYEPVNSCEEWFKRYSRIANYLHGKKMKVYLEDDPDWYYEGRFSVENWKSGKQYSELSIKYNVGPYKWSKKTFAEELSEYDDWLWDPFSFIDGAIITQYKNINLNQSNRSIDLDMHSEIIGNAPIRPTFTITLHAGAMMHIRWTTPSLDHGVTHYHQISESGVYTFDDIIMYGRTVFYLYLINDSGSADISIDFRRGSL